jgi:peptidoglycan hydrolase CwlO-like protein|tara:strand:+ start:3150 stop:3431 length:282 start_codon:yes stop_codon:yes gene_type:complete
MTTTSIIIISVLSVLILILGYTTFNLLRKVEKSEDLIVKYDNYVTEFSKQIEASDKRLNEIDMKGMFKSDDEIGWFFEQIKVLQNGISEFKNS